MAKHPRPEPRQILATIRAHLPTCILCSWVWDPDPVTGDRFLLKRPHLGCGEADHRKLLDPAAVPTQLLGWLQAS